MIDKKLPLLEVITDKKYAILAIIFLIALFSRIYCLNSFPYFPRLYPWVGAGADPPLDALYIDEYVYYTFAIGVENSIQPVVYQPWLQLLLINFSVSLFGASGFAVRLPSAFMSTLSIVLVYLICTKKFGNRLAAFLSSLYLVVMMPALVLNRMAFLENSVVLFFLASYFCLLQYSDGEKERWLLGAAVLAGLSALSKINGLVALLFFIFYLLRAKVLTKNLRYVGIAVGIASIFPIVSLVLYNFDIGSLFSQFISQWQLSTGWLEFSIWRYFFLNAMPSGYNIQMGGYQMLEFWYLFTIFGLVYLASFHLRKISDEVLAIALFVTTFFILGSIGAYYMIMIQPFLCIPIGYALTKLVKGSTLTTFFFCFFIYTPAVLSVDLYLASGLALLVLEFVTIGVPILLLFGQLLRGGKFPKKSRRVFNTAFLTVFFVFLIAGSYMLPVFYPNYFVGP